MAATFVGYSSAGSFRDTKLHDLDLIKADILNQYNTRLGERLMLPNYGSIVWEILFEPLTDQNKEKIVDDAKKIIKGEPRVELNRIDSYQRPNGILLDIDLFFKPFYTIDNLKIFFDRQSDVRT